MAVKNADVRGKRAAMDYLRSTAERPQATITFYKCGNGHYLNAGEAPHACPICGNTSITTISQTEMQNVPFVPVDGYIPPEILDEADIS